MSTRVIALNNQKGGVGKTTTTYHLARAAQRRGLKVLAIDIDPQGNLTRSLSREPLDVDSIGLADVLSSRAESTMEEVIVPSLWDGVDLVPTTGLGLAMVRDELLATPMGRETKLKNAIESLGEGKYDLVLIDCPPSTDQLTINAMVAANAVLIVTHTKMWSMDGMGILVENVSQVQKHYNPHLQIAGIVINQFEKAQKDEQARKLELMQGASDIGIEVFEPVIPKNVIIPRATENGGSLDGTKTEVAANLVKIYDRYIVKLIQEN